MSRPSVARSIDRSIGRSINRSIKQIVEAQARLSVKTYRRSGCRKRVSLTMTVSRRFRQRSDEVSDFFPHRRETVLGLFELYYERVYCFVRRSLPAAQAEDIAQEVFVRLLEHRNLENLSINVSYLIKIADNLMKRRYQRGQRFNRYLRTKEEESRRHESADATPAGSAAGAPFSFGVRFDSEDMRAAFERLSPNERDAVRLIICEDMSYEAAATSLGVNVTTVNNWKFRGLRKLRDYAEQLEKQPGPGEAGADADAGAQAAERRRAFVGRADVATARGGAA